MFLRVIRGTSLATCFWDTTREGTLAGDAELLNFRRVTKDACTRLRDQKYVRAMNSNASTKSIGGITSDSASKWSAPFEALTVHWKARKYIKTRWYVLVLSYLKVYSRKSRESEIVESFRHVQWIDDSGTSAGWRYWRCLTSMKEWSFTFCSSHSPLVWFRNNTSPVCDAALLVTSFWLCAQCVSEDRSAPVHDWMDRFGFFVVLIWSSWQEVQRIVNEFERWAIVFKLYSKLP